MRLVGIALFYTPTKAALDGGAFYDTTRETGNPLSADGRRADE